MTVVVKKIKSQEKDEYQYIPHKIRSRPFNFIGLPFLGVLVTMFYWLILCPIIFAKFWLIFGNHCCWMTYFWITALIIFIILFSVLVCIWRCSPRRRRDSHYKITVEEKDDMESINDIMLKEIPKLEQDEIKNIEEDKIFPRCSVRKTRPKSLALIQEDPRPVSQNLSSPLTPRELFFLDLIETANKSCSSVTHTFIETEKRNYSPSGNPMRCSSEERQKSCSSPSEFFIANIPVENTCTSQVFLYVDKVDSEPQFRITCENAEVVID